jgi:Phage integrase family
MLSFSGSLKIFVLVEPCDMRKGFNGLYGVIARSGKYSVNGILSVSCAEPILDEYLKASKLREKPDTPLFPTTLGKSRELGSRPMTRFDGANLLKRRLRDAGIVGDYSPHSFRATGITNYLENGGTLEVAQRIAGHADRTTKLYDRRGQKVLLEDMGFGEQRNKMRSSAFCSKSGVQ